MGYLGNVLIFTKDACTRTELRQHEDNDRSMYGSADTEIRESYRQADVEIRAALNGAVASLERQYGEVRSKIDTMQRDIADFKTESTADRRSLSVKIDTILNILTNRTAATTPNEMHKVP